MSRYRSRRKKIIELFDEKTGCVVRTVSFDGPRDFEVFLKDFAQMRYPGYGWRYKDTGRKKGEDVPGFLLKAENKD